MPPSIAHRVILVYTILVKELKYRNLTKGSIQKPITYRSLEVTLYPYFQYLWLTHFSSLVPSKGVLYTYWRWEARLHKVDLMYFYEVVLRLYVVSSHPGGAEQNGMVSTVGIMQALISVFLDDHDKLRCINAGRTRITFLLRPPLYYACASSWGEPESIVGDYVCFQLFHC